MIKATIRPGWLWPSVVLCAVLVGGLATYALAAFYTSAAPARIDIKAMPIASFDVRDQSRQRFGMLEFRGGLDLTSSYRAFGGISAIRIAEDGAKFIAVSDRGSWLRGRIVYSGGRPSAIADAEMAPMLGADGKPLAGRGWYDAESLAQDGDTLYVGLEKVEQIVRFDYGRRGLMARGEPVAVPDDFKTLDHRKSLECLDIIPRGLAGAGTLIAVTEQSLDQHGDHRSFLLNGDTVVRFSVKRTDEFDVSDCAILPPGDFLLLERRFSPLRGLAIRIRLLRLEQLQAGAVVDGPVVIEADLGYEIDNMEGLAVHRNAKGETILTLISDDNFSSVQRTILLQFALMRE